MTNRPRLVAGIIQGYFMGGSCEGGRRPPEKFFLRGSFETFQRFWNLDCSEILEVCKTKIKNHLNANPYTYHPNNPV